MCAAQAACVCACSLCAVYVASTCTEFHGGPGSKAVDAFTHLSIKDY